MLQRSGTYVIQASKGLFMLHKGMYEEAGPPLEDADIFANSLPNAVQFGKSHPPLNLPSHRQRGE